MQDRQSYLMGVLVQKITMQKIKILYMYYEVTFIYAEYTKLN